MAVTSIDLAMDNLTQVEKFGAKSVVYILAILKPTRTEAARPKKDPGFQSFYKEITYPLGAGFPPNPEYYQPAGIPRTKAYSHARQSETTANPPNVVPLADEVGGPSPAPAQRSLVPPPNADSTSEPDERSSSNRPRPEIREIPLTAERNIPDQRSVHPAEPTARMDIIQNASARERLSTRDLQATRTFAILPMLKAGDNPWDLGSRFLNLKTVMGMQVLDWFLPIRRSPSCNHEDAESQFQLGPWVDLLKSSIGFIAPQEPSTLRRRRKRRHHRSETSANGNAEDGQRHDRTLPEFQFATDRNIPSSRPGPSILMQDFNSASAASRPV
jgi:palmitoyltransferase